MTESEWLRGDELWQMLHHALDEGLFPARKQFLFCVAACRLRGAAVPVDYLAVLNDLEAFADEPDLPPLPPGVTFWQSEQAVRGVLTPHRGRLQDLGRRAEEILFRRYGTILTPGERHPWEGDPRFEADDAVVYAVLGNPFACAFGDGKGCIRHSRPEADLLRDLLGNLFKQPPFNTDWLIWQGGTALKLAASIYGDRQLPSGHLDQARLAVLADALEEAGCTEADLLDHLRGPGPHVRGCFVLDLLLGKE
jgi:hypothetical protein